MNELQEKIEQLGQESKHEEQADTFLQATNTVIKTEWIGTYNRNDFGVRDNYKITITRGARSIQFDFSQSLQNSGRYHIVKDNAKGLYKTIYGLCDRFNTFNPVIVYDSFKIKDKKDKEFTDKWFKHALQNHHLIAIRNSNYSTPRNYNILACLQKYPVDSLESFCSDFGYDTDSRKAEKLYNACKEEYLQVATIWNDEELDALREIN